MFAPPLPAALNRAQQVQILTRFWFSLDFLSWLRTALKYLHSHFLYVHRPGADNNWGRGCRSRTLTVIWICYVLDKSTKLSHLDWVWEKWFGSRSTGNRNVCPSRRPRGTGDDVLTSSCQEGVLSSHSFRYIVERWWFMNSSTGFFFFVYWWHQFLVISLNLSLKCKDQKACLVKI